MFELAIEKIKAAQSIAVLTHISEDADAAGSAFALEKALRAIGKTIHCYFSDSLEERLNFLEDDYIVYENGMNVECELCICLDTGDMGRLGDRCAIFQGARATICIDHHYTNTKFADVNIVDGNAPATGELVYHLLKEMGVEITSDIAECLYVAIAADTGCFKYSSVRPETMRIVASLMETGIDHARLCRILFDTFEMNIMKLKGYVMNNVESHYDGKVSIVSIPAEIFKRFNVTEKESGDLVNLPRMVIGTEIAVAVREKGEGVKVSLRSNGKYNVGEISLKFGGGGHKMAAGITFKNKSIEEVEKEVIKACGEMING